MAEFYNSLQPRELGHINFSEFTAAGTVTLNFPKALNRNVRRRAIILYSSLNVNISSQRVTMKDSFFSDSGRSAGNSATTNSTVTNSGTTQVIDGHAVSLSGNFGEMLNAICDTFSISFTIGDIVPTTGFIKIAVVEVPN